MIGIMEIIKADTIGEYDRFFGFCTRHPLVDVVHFNRNDNQPTHKMAFGLYALFLIKTVGITMDYGKTQYDFNEGTVVCLAPGQTIGVNRMPGGPVPEAFGLLFHPDIMRGAGLSDACMKRYTFFSYSSNEALHLSLDECVVIQDYMKKIDDELGRTPDRYSQRLLVLNIEVLLDYCMRFYERQFASRMKIISDVFMRFEQLLDAYWEAGTARSLGLPTVKYFADKVCLSPNYFGDLVKAATGVTARDHIRLKIIEKAKDALLMPEMGTKRVADMLGFQYPQHFIRFFKGLAGCTPKEYRAMNGIV